MGITINPLTGLFDFTGSSGGGGGSISGTIAAPQVAFGTAADTIGGSADLIWTGSALLSPATLGLIDATGAITNSWGAAALGVLESTLAPDLQNFIGPRVLALNATGIGDGAAVGIQAQSDGTSLAFQNYVGVESVVLIAPMATTTNGVEAWNATAMSSGSHDIGLLDIAGLHGFVVANDHESSGRLAESIGIRLRDLFTGGSAGPITQQIGLDILDQTKGDTNYAIRTGLGAVTFGDVVQAAGYKSSDGTVGATSGTFKNGLYIGGSLGSGTVTSVAASVPTFLSIAGSPITTAGTLAITYSGTALPVANGGTAATSASITAFNNITGLSAAGTTGTTSTNLVLSGSPTIVTPTIASLVNANHTHLNAAGGGTITAAAVTDLNTATIAFSNKSGNISQWTNDSGYLTAVTAHNVLSATHGDTLTASVVRGDVIIGNSTPKWSRLAIGSSGKVLTSDGTDVSWQTPAAGGVTSIATTSPISGGTITSTGTLSLLVNVDFAFTATQSVTKSINATSTDGLVITNTTAAAAGAQQWSPRLRLTGQGWKTTATAASQTVDWILENQPVQGAATPTTQCVLSSQVNAAGFTKQLVVTSNDGVYIAGAGSATQGWICSNTGGASSGPNIKHYFGLVFDPSGTANKFWMSASSFGLASTMPITWDSTTVVTGNSPDVTLVRGGAAATLQMGADVNGAAVSQQFGACNGITGTDKTGGNLTLVSGKGTGAGAVSSLIFQTPTVLGSGTTAQSLATRLTLSSAGATFVAGITTIGGAVFHTTSSALTDGVGSSAGTITNAPSIGNPTKWIGISDNGVTRYIPAW